MAFSKEEFDIMVNELLYREPISFNMLCHIADKTLKNKIKSWCKAEACLDGRGFEDDIMQEVHIRLIKTTISLFLLKDGVQGPVNNDPDGFRSWMFKVAENIKKDFANKVRNDDFKTENIDDSTAENTIAAVQEYDAGDEHMKRLRKAFSIVMSADVNVYKVLTWIAQFIFIIDSDITKIQSNDKIISTFEEKTLFEMYDMLLNLSKQIDWICITETQNSKIQAALNRQWDDKSVYGNVKYKDFFMKYKGVKSGKKSISDWVNRMNDMLRKKAGKNYILNKTTCEEGRR